MDGTTVAGISIIIAVIGLFLLTVLCIAAVLAKGFDKLDRHERNRAIERELRNEVIDANVRQAAARKILQEYEGG
jgi:hypothetical protein